MCTTALLIGTLVVMLRRRFFNKVEPAPWHGTGPRAAHGKDPQVGSKEKLPPSPTAALRQA
uniref:Uncharacterized protein n=1 Tax=Anas platyrhynchos TaxID=8839 RepID=A0A8B9SXL0_ANAPL